MSRSSITALTKLLRAYNKNGIVNIIRKDGVTSVTTMSDDYVTIFKCAMNTIGEDRDEISVKNVSINTQEGGVEGDQQDDIMRIARLPEFGHHLINFNADGPLLTAAIKNHAAITTKTHNGQPISEMVMNIKGNILYLSTIRKDVGINEFHHSRLNITETERLPGQRFDAKILYEQLLKWIKPEEYNILIQYDKYPLEIRFRCGTIQCYYIQAPRIPSDDS